MPGARRSARVGAAIIAAAFILLPAEASADATCLGRRATIIGTGGPDRLEGTRGADVLVGLGGDDRIDGLAGDDLVCAGSGLDAIRSGPGDDVVLGGPGDDRLKGGAGTDTAAYLDVRTPGGVTVDLTAGVSSASHGVDTVASIENVDGSPGHDVLIGDGGPNRLRAYAGLDRLDGRNGDDVLRGAGGRDRLDGGRGVDDCAGEAQDRCE